MKTTTPGKPVASTKPDTTRQMQDSSVHSSSLDAREAVEAANDRRGADVRPHFQPEAASATTRTKAGTVYVVLPAYNEGENLPALLRKIETVFATNERKYQVIVVDDASTDNTAEIASRASFEIPLVLVQHRVNQNLPGALRTGFETAIKMADVDDIIVTMDGDDTHPPGTIIPLIQKIGEGYDVMIASRFQPGSRVVGVPPLRVLMAFGARMLFKTIMPIAGVRDYTCGYRAYRASVLRHSMEFYGDQFVSEMGFSCMADVLLKMRRFKFVIGEVPLLLRYDQKQGGSKMAVAKTVWLSIKLLVKRRLGGY
jgi:dolichol-phosphate mannosyltransferase